MPVMNESLDDLLMHLRTSGKRGELYRIFIMANNKGRLPECYAAELIDADEEIEQAVMIIGVSTSCLVYYGLDSWKKIQKEWQ